jgi:integrase
MARVRRSTDLGSRESRRDLRARPEPYFMVLERGMSLGYRRSKEGGSWVVRRHEGRINAQGKPVSRHTERRVGTADDGRDADGVEVLSFAQAQRKVLAEATLNARRTSGQLYSVADAVADYLEHQRAHRKSVYQTESKLKAYVSPQLGARLVAELKPTDFEMWLKWAFQRRRKLKKPPVEPTVARAHVDQDERQRRRKATMNRVITVLKACLNHAYATRKVPSRDAWARLKKFRSVDSARLRWLTVVEAKRLQNACAPNFRMLVRAALLTGCRAGELLALRARDFDVPSKTLLIADSKSGKPRRVPLTPAGVTLFDDLTAGRLANDPVFARADGSPWYRVAIIRAMHDACEAGKISPAATFHTLRHTYASHLISQHVPLLFVASALGHRDARMVEKHYGHLAPSHVADLIRRKLPTFGRQSKSKVRSLTRSQA